MARITPYANHKMLEGQYLGLVKVLDAGHRIDAAELKATALEKLRNDQILDARFYLSGKRVNVYQAGELKARISNCAIGDATATVCFTLEERSGDGVVVNFVPVTVDMDIFVEHAHG